jgi:hypothetical protein
MKLIAGIFLLCIFLLSSCAFHQGNMSGSAALNHSNFKMVKVVYGSATAQYFLGLGGLNKDGLLIVARQNLYSQNTIKKGQVLANLSVDFKRSFYFIYWETKATITADLIDFNNLEETNTEAIPTNSTFLPSEYKQKEVSDFQLKEEVIIPYMGQYHNGTIQVLNSKKAYVAHKLKDGMEVTTEKPLHKVFKIQNTGSFGIKEKIEIGDSIMIQYINRREYGVITALGMNSFLSNVVKANGNTKTIEFPYNSYAFNVIKKK